MVFCHDSRADPRGRVLTTDQVRHDKLFSGSCNKKAQEASNNLLSLIFKHVLIKIALYCNTNFRENREKSCEPVSKQNVM